MITDIADFFDKGCGRCPRFATPDCSIRLWHDGLLALRDICLSTGLTETLKWGHPCYVRGTRNIAIFGAFRADFRLTFFNAALLRDPEGLLEKQGPNTQTPDAIRFTDNAQVSMRETAIRAYLAEAVGYADAGIKPAKVATDLDLPDTLIEALDTDPELAEAFHALTPGRQKSYVIALSSTKSPATQMTRITRLRGNILAGKGAMER